MLLRKSDLVLLFTFGSGLIANGHDATIGQVDFVGARDDLAITVLVAVICVIGLLVGDVIAERKRPGGSVNFLLLMEQFIIRFRNFKNWGS